MYIQKSFIGLIVLLVCTLLVSCEEEPVEILLDKPSSFEATDGQYYDQIVLTWNNIGNNHVYEIFRFDSTRNDFVKIGFSTESLYEDSLELDAHIKYSYKLRYKTVDDQYSEFSNPEDGYRVNRIEEPKNLLVSKGDYLNKIIIQWDTVSSAEFYDVYRIGSDKDINILIGNTHDTFLVDSSSLLTPLTHYYYYIISKRSNGDYSSESAKHYGYINKNIDAPNNLYASREHVDKIILSWEHVTEAKEYIIYRKDPHQENYNEYKRISAVNFEDYITENLEEEYFYKIKAISVNGFISDFSNEISGSTAPFASPSELDASYGTSTSIVTIKWKTTHGSDSYILYRSLTKDGSFEPIIELTDSSYNDDSINPIKTYYYKVQAKNNNIGLAQNVSPLDSGYILQTYQYIKSWGGYGSDPANLDWPYGVTVYNDQIYISDYGHHKIKVFNVDGEYLNMFGVLNYPRGLIFDDAGNLYVANSGAGNVKKYDINGNLLDTWNSGGLSQALRDVAYYNNTIYLIDSGNEKLKLFNLNGTLVNEINRTKTNNGGYLWGVEVFNNKVITSDTKNFVEIFNLNLVYEKILMDVYASHITKDENYIYLALGNQLMKINLQGKIISKIETGEIKSYSASAIDSQGNLYITDGSASLVHKLSPVN